MRAALLEALPLLMHFYPGLKPWDLHLFSPVELEVLLDALPDGR